MLRTPGEAVQGEQRGGPDPRDAAEAGATGRIGHGHEPEEGSGVSLKLGGECGLCLG